MDFTLKEYERLLIAISKNNIPLFSIKNWIESNPDSGILLRHDIDRKPKNALKTAILEKKYGICSTYYFRVVKSSFNSLIIKKILKLGHEIGYHYEDLSVTKGDFEKAIELFERNLHKFREIADINTISMHGRPLSVHDNRDLWKKYKYESFNLTGEAFLSINYNDIFYFTDTGRSWSHRSVNIRDKVNSMYNAEIKNTKELIDFILLHKLDKIALVTHPERWADNSLEFLVNFLKDLLINTIKRLIRLLRRNGN